MLLHADFPNNHAGRKQLYLLIQSGAITLAGNRSLKIYGTLRCGSGKRMKQSNRVFFASEQEAVEQGYRPCGNCLRGKYRQTLNANSHCKS